MVDSFKFKLNKKIEIDWEDGFYKSSICDLTEDEMFINIPVGDGNKYLPLHVGDTITAHYFENDSIYKFRTIVTRRKVDKIFLVGLKIPNSKDIHRFQRRDYVRINVILDAFCAVIKERNNLDNVYKLTNDSYDFLNATVLDLSGGGAKIAIDKELELYNKLILNIVFEDEQLLVKGKIVRKCESDTKKNVYGLKFEDIDLKIRETIIRFIFLTMQKQLRRT